MEENAYVHYTCIIQGYGPTAASSFVPQEEATRLGFREMTNSITGRFVASINGQQSAHERLRGSETCGQRREGGIEK